MLVEMQTADISPRPVASSIDELLAGPPTDSPSSTATRSPVPASSG